MLKLFITILLIILFSALGSRCYCQTQFSPIITKMETSLFGIDYPQQPDEARLQRIETAVYGTPSSKPLEQRVKKLTQDLAADLYGQEIAPKSDTFAEDTDAVKDIPKADNTVNYPIVNNIEIKVLGKEYRNLDINQRLCALEQQLFKKTYSDDLNTRVDRLKMAVMPGSFGPKDLENDDNQLDELAQTDNPAGFAANVPQLRQRGLPTNDDSDDSEADSDINAPLASLEQCILKKSFPNDTVGNRLTRLELMVFNSTFSDDDIRTRFDRLASAYQAKKSSQKYDNNKFAQHMAAAMEVGAFLLCILAAIL